MPPAGEEAGARGSVAGMINNRSPWDRSAHQICQADSPVRSDTPVDVTGARSGRRGLPRLVLWLTVTALCRCCGNFLFERREICWSRIADRVEQYVKAHIPESA
jgi:hypothetical protein